MQTFLVILFVIIALCLVIAASVSMLCGEVRGLKNEADEKEAEMLREIEKWRSGK